MIENILVVDDEQAITDLIEIYLKNENYNVTKFYNGQDALRYIEREKVDLAILDVMLPDMNGFTVCQRIRENHHFPVIMLTAKDEETDKITGLTLGADDYMTKPFRPLEMVARVKAQLRRYKKYQPMSKPDEGIISYSGLVMNVNTHECWLNEETLSLTPTEFSILRMLCENKGKVVSSEQLFHAIWGNEYYNKNNNTITVHIRHLREKMSDSVDHPKWIRTIWGWGIKLKSKKQLTVNYAKLRMKVFIRMLMLILLALVAVDGLYLLVRGRLGEGGIRLLQYVTGYEYKHALSIYESVLREHWEIIMLIAISAFFYYFSIFLYHGLLNILMKSIQELMP